MYAPYTGIATVTRNVDSATDTTRPTHAHGLDPPPGAISSRPECRRTAHKPLHLDNHKPPHTHADDTETPTTTRTTADPDHAPHRPPQAQREGRGRVPPPMPARRREAARGLYGSPTSRSSTECPAWAHLSASTPYATLLHIWAILAP